MGLEMYRGRRPQVFRLHEAENVILQNEIENRYRSLLRSPHFGRHLLAEENVFQKNASLSLYQKTYET